MNKELLDTLFNYDPETGIVTWKIRRSNRIKVGSVVGYKTPYGYLQVRLEGKLWMLHRLIWMMQTGELPKNEIDHKNGQRSCNIWDNLRDVAKSVNMQNRHKADKDSLTGFLGVCWDKKLNKYRAQRVINGEKVLNKLFDSPIEAHNAYNQAKENYYHFRN